MSDSTRVDPDALLEFATALTADLQGYATGTASALMPAGLAAIGGSGMQEAVWAGAGHTAALDAARQLVSDTCDGLLALSYVAAAVAEQYRHADADQAAQMAAVTSALNPPPGQPSIATRRAAEAEAQAAAAAAARETARYLNQLDRGTTTDGEAHRFQNQVDAAGRPASPPPAMGGATVGNGAPSTEYSRYVNEVLTHNAFVSGGTGGASAEDEYSPRAEYDEAVAEAAARSEQFHIPYVVQVDDHGHSDVVQADPDDVPYIDPADVVEPGFGSVAAPRSSPTLATSGD
ncbi:hypothetical protein TEK04_13965 [Klenkia sp. LSe6-5]|uniref:PPE family protein n=1 Tax=Klenkia sesuvii TaxID=3103137 RepID=A0ABU8DVK0_9ACTN